MRRLFAAAVCVSLGLATTAEAKRRPPDPVKVPELEKDGGWREVELKDVKAKEGGFGEPTVIKTEEELKKAVGEDAAKAVKVDFKKEYLALFSWSGSGGDKLTHASEVKDGKTVVTSTYKGGLTRDLRPHVHLIALPVGAEWKMAK